MIDCGLKILMRARSGGFVYFASVGEDLDAELDKRDQAASEA